MMEVEAEDEAEAERVKASIALYNQNAQETDDQQLTSQLFK